MLVETSLTTHIHTHTGIYTTLTGKDVVGVSRFVLTSEVPVFAFLGLVDDDAVWVAVILDGLPQRPHQHQIVHLSGRGKPLVRKILHVAGFGILVL